MPNLHPIPFTTHNINSTNTLDTILTTTNKTTSYIITASSLGEEGRGLTPPTATTINSIILPGNYYILRSYF